MSCQVADSLRDAVYAAISDHADDVTLAYACGSDELIETVCDLIETAHQCTLDRRDIEIVRETLASLDLLTR